MPNGISIVATSRYLYVSRADGSLVSRHLTIEDAIEAAVNAGVGEYTIVCPSRRVKVYGVLPPTDPPATPAGLVADEITAGYVALSWTASANATLYQVYRDGAPTGPPTSDTTYTDSTVAPSTAYSYQVQASNGSGSSALSAAVLATTAANAAPNWLLGDQTGIFGAAFSLDLRTVCSDDDGHSLTFTLVSGTVPGVALNAPNYSGTPSAVGAYPLTFRANDGYATSDVTITFTVSDPDVTAPTVPTNVAASANGSTVTVSWTASTDAANSVAHYRVYRGGVFRAISATSPYVETGVPVGSYGYTVSAVDSSTNANESAQSSAAPVTVVPQTPDTPVAFTAVSDGSTTINLSWVPGPHGAAPDDYDLDFSAVSASGPWTSLPTGLVTSYVHSGRTLGTTYYYRVKAKLGAAESGYAATSEIAGVSGTVIAGTGLENLATGAIIYASDDPLYSGYTAGEYGTPDYRGSASNKTTCRPIVVASPVYAGSKALKFTIPASAASTANFRSEISWQDIGEGGGAAYQNVEHFIGWAEYLDAAWPLTELSSDGVSGLRSVLFQHHTKTAQPGGDPLISLITSLGTYQLTTEMVNGVNVNFAVSSDVSSDRGAWRRWVVHIKYNDAGAGFIKVYRGTGTDALALLRDTGAMTTVPSGTTQLGYYKFGDYSAGRKFVSGAERVNYIDALRIASSASGATAATVDPLSYA